MTGVLVCAGVDRSSNRVCKHGPSAIHVREIWTTPSRFRPLTRADVLLYETQQDILEVKAAVMGGQRAMRERGKKLPIVAQVTVDRFSKMQIFNTDIHAALVTVMGIGIDVFGINCSIGPDLMTKTVEKLARYSPLPISVVPNAGLPVSEAGRTVFKFTPEKMAAHLDTFVREFGVNIVGGCCGTTPDHIRAITEAVRARKPAAREKEPIRFRAAGGGAARQQQDAGHDRRAAQRARVGEGAGRRRKWRAYQSRRARRGGRGTGARAGRESHRCLHGLEPRRYDQPAEGSCIQTDDRFQRRDVSRFVRGGCVGGGDQGVSGPADYQVDVDGRSRAGRNESGGRVRGDEEPLSALHRPRRGRERARRHARREGRPRAADRRERGEAMGETRTNSHRYERVPGWLGIGRDDELCGGVARSDSVDRRRSIPICARRAASAT